jgi:hypothetical protein
MPATLHPHPEAMQTDLTEHLVVVHGQSGAAFRLNATARELWLALPATRAQLVELLSGRYGIDTGQAATDVDAALETLRAAGLLAADPQA